MAWMNQGRQMPQMRTHSETIRRCSWHEATSKDVVWAEWHWGDTRASEKKSSIGRDGVFYMWGKLSRHMQHWNRPSGLWHHMGQTAIERSGAAWEGTVCFSVGLMFYLLLLPSCLQHSWLLLLPGREFSLCSLQVVQGTSTMVKGNKIVLFLVFHVLAGQNLMSTLLSYYHATSSAWLNRNFKLCKTHSSLSVSKGHLEC